ncbi:hypothetical protein DFH28DRAFT_333853 [Melampsora americana]|nr:hypothetical protein DFH28DRAFT_333853 [Melampsora americana]
MNSISTTTTTTNNKPITKSESIQSKPKKIKSPNIYSKLLPINLNTSNTYHPFTYLKARLWSSNHASSHQIILGTLDSDSGSVIVKGEDQFQVLWRCGFFGKGNLSRSEPTWLQRARNRHALNVTKSDHGLKLTAEELTAKRRIERREAKIEKAKEKERLLKLEEIQSNPSNQENQNEANSVLIQEESLQIDQEDLVKEKEMVMINGHQTKSVESGFSIELLNELEMILNLEHLQLKPEDAFFLSYGINCLEVEKETFDKDSEATEVKGQKKQMMSIDDLWNTFCSNANPNPQRKPDNAFIVSYVAYHHFRSLGWVVRDGVKFCVDWVLYGSRGPVGGHAEFAVCVIPVYEDPNDQEEIQVDLSNQKRNWNWLSTVNRVCSGVKKTLVLAYVIIPSKEKCGIKELKTPEDCLRLYSVKEVVIKRFIPSRMRD